MIFFKSGYSDLLVFDGSENASFDLFFIHWLFSFFDFYLSKFMNPSSELLLELSKR